MGLAQDLQRLFGLDEGAVNYRTDLSKDELFDAAVAGDRGRVTPDGPDDAQKAFPTALGKEGPLVFYTDPSCTGRPVQDTFGVAHPSIDDEVWWKNDFQKFDPEKFGPLLERVGQHLNEQGAKL